MPHQLLPGGGPLFRGRRCPARRPVLLRQLPLTLGEPGLVGVDVQLFGVDPDAQLGALAHEPGLQPHRQQHDRHLAVQRGHGLLELCRPDPLADQTDPLALRLLALVELAELGKRVIELLLRRGGRLLRGPLSSEPGQGLAEVARRDREGATFGGDVDQICTDAGQQLEVSGHVSHLLFRGRSVATARTSRAPAGWTPGRCRPRRRGARWCVRRRGTAAGR